MTTQEGADDLAALLEAKDASKSGIKRRLELDDKGILKPGVYVVYGDDPGDKKGPQALNEKTGKLEARRKA